MYKASAVLSTFSENQWHELKLVYQFYKRQKVIPLLKNSYSILTPLGVGLTLVQAKFMVPHTANTHTHTHTPVLVTSRFGAPSFKTFDGKGRSLETVAVEDKAITYSIAAMNVLHNIHTYRAELF